ncbi:MAG: type II toxin-antitoxin system RelB/DinJ family antitoxin [Lachnospiraceae bacterium]|nr:type II toxin-antitoxin system RelB/DinJ family antitoxin [Lachnospiraceae bacterium]MBO7095569.1 type II toxin-antitoxin system RelB/DinJ family antitoxin [Lachnospiraceae bacterium]MBO7363287.1 type II toxin-antitoxin system RelB/DinJ family antitoxin [Lachnospiraceae bacterium]MBO7530753.1 type II toxin-antitoxin system RelB/DinJ family antitoxin [Lachnospiraceae bacterium]MBP5253420.1 type II toxin-antitoxin system RelB/DinJ family antitoxin [Lachnospiraceae bacterium]
MAKTATVSARIDEDVKDQAEDIMRQLGIPVSVVINTLYHQIINKNGIPFTLTLSDKDKDKEKPQKGDKEND